MLSSCSGATVLEVSLHSQWDTLPDYTQGPYFLTLKTNGCIIFISALTPSQLLITSKHAIGSARTGNLDLSSEYDGPGVDASEAAEEGPEAEEESPAEEEAIASGMPSENDRKSAFEKLTHAGVGEFWLDKHLSSRGLSRADLAKELWDAKVTAVAELTDDSFEEHVLPTPANQTGLVLHGLNRNFAGGVEGDSAQEGKSGGTSELETFDMDVVEAFANKWGFHPTPYKVVPTLDDVRKECERVEKSGWGAEGVMVEGIVVRGSPKSDSPRTTGADKTVKGSKFWKVKFAEPYLMYREWRELTRRLMAERKKLIKEWNGSHPRQKATTDLSDFLRKGFAEKVHVDKMKNPQSRLYVAWLVEQLLTRPQTWFEEWAKGRAIVSTREDFFAWRETDEGKKEAKRLGVSTQDGVDGDRNGVLTDTSDKKADKEFDKTLLVPIAAPGCGTCPQPSRRRSLNLTYPLLQARRSSESLYLRILTLRTLRATTSPQRRRQRASSEMSRTSCLSLPTPTCPAPASCLRTRTTISAPIDKPWASLSRNWRKASPRELRRRLRPPARRKASKRNPRTKTPNPSKS